MKKLLTILLIIVLLIGFGYGCFYIFNAEEVIEGNIRSVDKDYIILEDNQKFNLNKDTKYTLFNDEISYEYLEDNFIRFNAEITKRDMDITKINLTNSDKKMYIMAFFKNDAKDEDIKGVKDFVEIINHVLSVNYISKEEAKEEMGSKSDLLKNMLDNLEDIPLQSYIVIEVDGNINQIVKYLNNSEIVSVVKY